MGICLDKNQDEENFEFNATRIYYGYIGWRNAVCVCSVLLGDWTQGLAHALFLDYISSPKTFYLCIN